MNMEQAVRTVLANYANFEGRSSRGEYWWWALAYFLGYIIAAAAGGIVGAGETLAVIFALALLVPNIAVAVRRFHDIGKSGWFVLLFLIPLIGFILWIYFFIKPSDEPNQYGPGPLAPVTG